MRNVTKIDFEDLYLMVDCKISQNFEKQNDL